MIRLMEYEGRAATSRATSATPTSSPSPELADVVRDVLGVPVTLAHEPLPGDDPRQRRPDITRARAPRLGAEGPSARGHEADGGGLPGEDARRRPPSRQDRQFARRIDMTAHAPTACRSCGSENLHHYAGHDGAAFCPACCLVQRVYSPLDAPAVPMPRSSPRRGDSASVARHVIEAQPRAGEPGHRDRQRRGRPAAALPRRRHPGPRHRGGPRPGPRRPSAARHPDAGRELLPLRRGPPPLAGPPLRRAPRPRHDRPRAGPQRLRARGPSGPQGRRPRAHRHAQRRRSCRAFRRPSRRRPGVLFLANLSFALPDRTRPRPRGRGSSPGGRKPLTPAGRSGPGGGAVGRAFAAMLAEEQSWGVEDAGRYAPST